MWRSIFVLAVLGAAGWFFAGTLTARDVMTPECRKRIDYLDASSRQLVKSSVDYQTDDVVRGNLATLCGASKLWGRLS
jgi:hypothetical protein